jgi:hypothetical protein
MEELVELIINPNTREFGIRLLSDTLGLKEIYRYPTAKFSNRFIFSFDKEKHSKIYKFFKALQFCFQKHNITLIISFLKNFQLSAYFHNLKH